MSSNNHQVGGDHYRNKAIQPWDAMKEWMSHEAFMGFLVGCVIKRTARWAEKDGLQDLKKAHHELGKAIEEREAWEQEQLKHIALHEASFADVGGEGHGSCAQCGWPLEMVTPNRFNPCERCSEGE